MIAVIDYGMGNLRSVHKALEKCGADVLVTSSPDIITDASKVVFPGVGAMPKCMEQLRKFHLIESIKKAAAEKPFLGICLGLQSLFSIGYEGSGIEGLAIIPGKVIRFSRTLTVPHMGWNRVRMIKDCPLFRGIAQESYFYFVHSYYVLPDIPDIVAGETDYYGMFTSVIWKDNLFGLQFHPEKSQRSGLRILRNFINL